MYVSKNFGYKKLVVGFSGAVILIVSLFLLQVFDAEAGFQTATSPQCTVCHTDFPLTVGLYSDSLATVALANPVNINTGGNLTFYVKVSGEAPGNLIGAGLKYPAEASPLGSMFNKQDPNTWTTFTPAPLLANNAAFSWNNYNINMTNDTADSDSNGTEVFKATLNVPSTAAPGSYAFEAYGGGTGKYGGSAALTVNVVDTTAPAQITDLAANYINPNITLTWTTPTPPDNSGSVSSFKIYRDTAPITASTIGGLTPVSTIAGTSAGSVNTWNDPNSGTLVSTTIYYYSVISVDAASNTSPISTGPKMSTIKSASTVPTATMVRPQFGSSLGQTVNFTAQATDDVTVTAVDFQVSTVTNFSSYTTVSGATLSSGKTTNGYWTASWSSAGVNGTRYVRAVARDAVPNSGTSGYFIYTFDNTAPSPVNMTAPANLSTLQNVVTLQASVQDNLGVSKVAFEVATDSGFTTGLSRFDGATLSSGTNLNGVWSRSFSTNIISNGTQYIRAAVFDGANNVSYSTAFQYTVNNSSDSVPHGNYSASTSGCASCHVTHAAPGSALLVQSQVTEVCMNCHDGTSAQKTQSIPSTYQHLFTTKNVECANCHDPHKNRTTAPINLLRDTYDSKTLTGTPADYNLCFDCHKNPSSTSTGFVQANADIYQFYSKASGGGTGTKGIDKGHFIEHDRYTFSDGSAIPVGYQLKCTDCHDQHGSSNKYQLKTRLGTNPNSISLTSTGILTVTEERNFCMACHNGTTKLYNTADTYTIVWDENVSAGHTNSTVRCTVCHGGAGTVAEKLMRGSHAPGAAESTGGQDCSGCHGTMQSAMSKSITTTFHHVVDYVTFQADYSLSSSCLQCHVDHDKFRPDMNAANKRGANLRTKYEAVNSATASNTDFINDATGGLCLSCHASSKTKGYNGAQTTQAIPSPATFNTSKHNYLVYSTFGDSVAGDNSTKFAANCSKCHNDYGANSLSYDFQTSSNPFVFGAHTSNVNAILAELGVLSPTTPVEEDLCYRCHTGSSTNDYYKGQDSTQGGTMTAKSQAVQTSFGRSYKHPITSTRNIHKTVEGISAGWAPANGNRHVECEDCHNVHASKSGTSRDGSTVGANGTKDGLTYIDDVLSGSLSGTWGVTPTVTYTTNGTPNASDKVSYARTNTPTRQWQICLKCHSDYAWDNGDTSSGTIFKGVTGTQALVPNSTFPLTTTTTNSGLNEQPDIGQQFNPGNYAYHPLFKVGLNQPGSGLNSNWGSSAGRRAASSTYPGGDGSGAYPYTSAITPAGLDNTFVNGWGTKSLVVCTDCHASSDDAPDGPHGSSQKWILRKAEARSVTTPTTTINLNPGTDPREIANFCVNCHRADVYGKGTGSETPAYGNLSRFNHAFRTASLTSPDGNCMGSGNTVLGAMTDSPSCLGCHGGREPGGIHGSSSTAPNGKRFCNGANWSTHTLTSGSSPGCVTVSNVDSVAGCNHHGTEKTSNGTLYYTY